MTRLKFVLSVAIVSLLLSGSMAVGAGWIGSGDIKDGGVHENDIGKMAVTKTKIKTGAVNKYKLATGAVNTYKILDETIEYQDLSSPVFDLLVELDRWAAATSDWAVAMTDWAVATDARLDALEGPVLNNTQAQDQAAEIEDLKARLKALESPAYTPADMPQIVE